MEKTTVGEGRFSLMIRGEALQKQELAEKLSLTATGLIRKGELLSRVPRIEATEDVWVYEIPLTDPEGEDTALNALLETLLARRDLLEELTRRYRVVLRLYVRSNRAHITYRLMPQTLQKLTEIGLPLELSSLSWGECGKNGTFPRIRSMNYDGIVKNNT